MPPKDYYERLAEAKKAAKLEADVKRICDLQKPFTIIGNFIIPNN